MSELTGYDRKTIRKYLLNAPAVPQYEARPSQASKLDPFKPYLQERLAAGIWNAQVLLRELRERSYSGGYTILKDWLHPQRQAGYGAAVRRFETAPGKQAQVDWGHLGYVETDGVPRKISGFRDHVELHPADVGAGGAGSKARHVAADARSRVRRMGRGSGRDFI